MIYFLLIVLAVEFEYCSLRVAYVLHITRQVWPPQTVPVWIAAGKYIGLLYMHFVVYGFCVTPLPIHDKSKALIV